MSWKESLPDVATWQPLIDKTYVLSVGLEMTCQAIQSGIINEATIEEAFNITNYDAGPALEDIVRDRRNELLFIDARKLGRMVDRSHREFTDADIARIADTYHAWRGEEAAGVYADIPGFCKSTALGEVRTHGHVLTPGRYVGVEAPEDDGEPFADKMKRLVGELQKQQAEGARLDAAITQNLKALGFWDGHA